MRLEPIPEDLSIDELANLLGWPCRTILEIVDSGALHPRQTSMGLRFPTEEARRFYSVLVEQAEAAAKGGRTIKES